MWTKYCKNKKSKTRNCSLFEFLCISTVKVKGSFYIAQYPVRWTAQSALHFLPFLADLFIPTSILATQQLRAKTKSLTFPPLSIARYSFKQRSQLGRQWRERKCPIFETVAKGDSNPASLDRVSGILPLIYRALLSILVDCFCVFEHPYISISPPLTLSSLAFSTTSQMHQLSFFQLFSSLLLLGATKGAPLGTNETL